MRVLVLDTDILIDNVHGFAPWIDKLLNKPKDYRLVIPTIVIAEYLTAQEVETELGMRTSEDYLSLFIKQDLTEDIARVLGAILRRKNYKQGASLADLIVAATAIQLGAELATRNKDDFAKIPNLSFFDLKKLRERN